MLNIFAYPKDKLCKLSFYSVVRVKCTQRILTSLNVQSNFPQSISSKHTNPHYTKCVNLTNSMLKSFNINIHHLLCDSIRNDL